MSLILNFDLVKGFLNVTPVFSRNNLTSLTRLQEARNMTLLDLIHFDLCEMNGVLTKGGKKYFMTLVYDYTRYCYVYLLKTKYEALYYFKI
jgi:hypothetical protein